MKFSEIVNKSKKKKKSSKDIEFEFYSDIANLITEARLHAGLTQKSLAEKLGTKQPAIARIESGLKLPSLSWLFELAKALDTYLIAPKFGFMEKKNRNSLLSYGDGAAIKSKYFTGNNFSPKEESSANVENIKFVTA
jgi:ribosome-binding protein aMBF1 (putative translation factor)